MARARRNFFFGKKANSFPTFIVLLGRDDFYITSKSAWDKLAERFPSRVKTLRYAGKQLGTPVFRDHMDRGTLLTEWLVKKAAKNPVRLNAKKRRRVISGRSAGPGLVNPRLANWTSDVGYSYDQFYRANPSARRNKGKLPVPAHLAQTPRSEAEGVYVYPAQRDFPIGDLYHARLALVYALSPSHARRRKKILSMVEAFWPQYNWKAWWNRKRKGKKGVKDWDSYTKGAVQAWGNPGNFEVEYIEWTTGKNKSHPSEHFSTYGEAVSAGEAWVRRHGGKSVVADGVAGFKKPGDPRHYTSIQVYDGSHAAKAVAFVSSEDRHWPGRPQGGIYGAPAPGDEVTLQDAADADPEFAKIVDVIARNPSSAAAKATPWAMPHNAGPYIPSMFPYGGRGWPRAYSNPGGQAPWVGSRATVYGEHYKGFSTKKGALNYSDDEEGVSSKKEWLALMPSDTPEVGVGEEVFSSYEYGFGSPLDNPRRKPKSRRFSGGSLAARRRLADRRNPSGSWTAFGPGTKAELRRWLHDEGYRGSEIERFIRNRGHDSYRVKKLGYNKYKVVEHFYDEAAEDAYRYRNNPRLHSGGFVGTASDTDRFHSFNNPGEQAPFVGAWERKRDTYYKGFKTRKEAANWAKQTYSQYGTGEVFPKSVWVQLIANGVGEPLSVGETWMDPAGGANNNPAKSIEFAIDKSSVPELKGYIDYAIGQSNAQGGWSTALGADWAERAVYAQMVLEKKLAARKRKAAATRAAKKAKIPRRKCPTCGARSGSPCRTASGKITSVHARRKKPVQRASKPKPRGRRAPRKKVAAKNRRRWR